jgi:recombinational DNA repair protein RecR
MEIDIFERVRKRLAIGKDFDPQMVIDLCRAYDEEISKLKAAQPSVQADCAYCHCSTAVIHDGVCINCAKPYKSHSH